MLTNVGTPSQAVSGVDTFQWFHAYRCWNTVQAVVSRLASFSRFQVYKCCNPILNSGFSPCHLPVVSCPQILKGCLKHWSLTGLFLLRVSWLQMSSRLQWPLAWKSSFQWFYIYEYWNSSSSGPAVSCSLSQEAFSLLWRCRHYLDLLPLSFSVVTL